MCLGSDLSRGTATVDSVVPGFSAGWRISGLIVFGPTRAYCGGSQALPWAPGVCVSVLDAKKPLHTRPMVAKRSFSSFTPASAPHPTFRAGKPVLLLEGVSMLYSSVGLNSTVELSETAHIFFQIVELSG